MMMIVFEWAGLVDRKNGNGTVEIRFSNEKKTKQIGW